MKALAAILIVFISLNSLQASRILFLFPTPSKSHVIIARALSTALAEKGHDVTLMSSFTTKSQLKNHREIFIELGEGTYQQMNSLMSNPTRNFYKMMNATIGISYEIGKDLMESKIMNDVMKEKFDLMVIGMAFTNFLLGLTQHFNCPVIMLSVQRHMSFTNLIIGNPLSVNTAPHIYIAKHDMNFIDRVKNFVMYGGDLLMYEIVNYHQRVIYDTYFPSTKFRSYDEALKNLSLILVNDHYTEGVVRPNIPTVVDIRGMHIKTVPDQLPNDIEKFLNEAKEGVIYFSLGTNVRADSIPQEKLQILLSVFSKLPQRVLMKWETENVAGKSDNVLIKTWLPQADILAHPNVKLFISHCGLGGIVESQYLGVPILGLPMFGDQMMNADLAEQEGWIIQMDLETLNEEEFYKNIQELLYNETYASTVKGFSRLFRDRPLSPKDTAVYWTEYVINHRGAKHMQYKAIHQNFWQRNSLDVIGFLLLSLWTIYQMLKYVWKKLVKKIIQKIIRKGTKKSEKRKKL
ncbi:hypothetical protein ACKWTF_006962 [Chironomus riparius]